jgi:hypothetical protein
MREPNHAIPSVPSNRDEEIFSGSVGDERVTEKLGDNGSLKASHAASVESSTSHGIASAS